MCPFPSDDRAAPRNVSGLIAFLPSSKRICVACQIKIIRLSVYLSEVSSFCKHRLITRVHVFFIHLSSLSCFGVFGGFGAAASQRGEEDQTSCVIIVVGHFVSRKVLKLVVSTPYLGY